MGKKTVTTITKEYDESGQITKETIVTEEFDGGTNTDSIFFNLLKGGGTSGSGKSTQFDEIILEGFDAIFDAFDKLFKKKK